MSKKHKHGGGKLQFRELDFSFTEKQKDILKYLEHPDTKVVFLTGPAGTSKSFISIYAALKLLDRNYNKDILYIRSVVESASRSMGYLPGLAAEKLEPYLMPLFDKCEEILHPECAKKLLDEQKIEATPVNFLRGASWKDRIVIVDECFTGDSRIVLGDGKTMISFKKMYKNFNDGIALPECLSYNEKNKVFEPKKIVSVKSNGKKPIFEIKFGNKKIKCTDNHKFLTQNGWKEAKSLQKGDGILTPYARHQTLNCLNDDQKQIVLGSWLGDGSIQSLNGRQRLKVLHGIKQEEYCLWKAKIMSGDVKYIEKNGYAQKPAIRFTTKMFPQITPYNKKSITKDDIKDLDWRGIAIWVMDDGSRQTNMLNIFTCSFDEPSQQVFVDKFKDLGVECKIKNHKNYKMLSFNTENAAKVFKNIAPYSHASMSYKIGDHTDLGTYQWDSDFNGPVCLFDEIVDLKTEEEVFDIEVEDNHNFIVYGEGKTTFLNKNKDLISGLVAHNCQNFTLKELITVMTRLGEGSTLFICGDPSQADIHNSGFQKVIDAFHTEESDELGIYGFSFEKEDIVRSQILKYIVERLETIK